MAENQKQYGACPGCDLLYQIPELKAGHHLVCNRCGTTLQKTSRNSIDRVLAFSSAGILLYCPAMLLPIMTLSSIGISVSGNIVQTGIGFFTAGYPIVAIMVLFTAVFFPLVKLLISFFVSLQLKLGRQPPILKKLFRLLLHLDEWGMLEVYLLGILVSLIKISSLASIDYGIGFFCFIGLVLLSIATTVSIDKSLFWAHIGTDQVPVHILDNTAGRDTANQQSLLSCHDCGLLVAKNDQYAKCPRCNATIHRRTPGTIQKTWGLVITSMILIIPANVLPIMRVDFLGIPDRSTIMDGIIYFFKSGSYGIGLIIFLASVLVPLFKIVGLLIILLTIRSRKGKFLKQKAKMFRFIEFIGRWSMLDIFVIALLTVLVDFGFFTSIHSAPGATFFCIVVICTMMAAIVFDPRVMWDRCESVPHEHNRHYQ